jgi:hypothetical protein
MLPGLCACGPDYVKRYDKPLTYAQAIRDKDIDFPLPPSSRNIYYGMYADWQAYTRLVRFEAPVADCLKHIETVFAWDDKIYKRTSSYLHVQVSHVDPVDTVWLNPTAWFDPDKITHGVYAGENASHKPEIWIDLERGVFYFRETD